MASDNGVKDRKPSSGGLRPHAQVNVPTASSSFKGDSQALMGADMYASLNSGFHDASYYENWNRKRQESIARGEDPNAEFLAKVRHNEMQGYQGKLRRFFRKMSGAEKARAHGEGLTEEEEKEAREKDVGKVQLKGDDGALGIGKGNDGGMGDGVIR